MTVSPAIHASCGGKESDAWIAVISIASIGFSVFQTSGANAISSAITANATANTASAAHSRSRSGGLGGQRLRGQPGAAPAGERPRAGASSRSAQPPREPPQPPGRQRAEHGDGDKRAEDRLGR